MSEETEAMASPSADGGGGVVWKRLERDPDGCYSFQKTGRCRWGAQCRWCPEDRATDASMAEAEDTCYAFQKTGVCLWGAQCKWCMAGGGWADWTAPGDGGWTPAWEEVEACYAFLKTGYCRWGDECKWCPAGRVSKPASHLGVRRTIVKERSSGTGFLRPGRAAGKKVKAKEGGDGDDGEEPEGPKAPDAEDPYWEKKAAIENRQDTDGSVHRGKIASWRNGWGFILAEDPTSLPGEAQVKMAEVAAEMEAAGRPAEENWIYFRGHDVLEWFTPYDGAAITFSVYLDDKGVGAHMIMGAPEPADAKDSEKDDV